MKSINYILENDATTIALLNDGANSVHGIEAPQGDPIPHIVVDFDIEPISTMSATDTEEMTVRVFAVSDRLYTAGGIAGAYEIGVACLAALEGSKGTFNSETISSVSLENESNYKESTDRMVVEQIYQVFKKR